MIDQTPVATAGRPAGLGFRKVRDRFVEAFLLAAALVAVFTTVAIVVVLVRESLPFFEHVSLRDFLTDTMWTPLFAEARYGILPLVAGTLVTTLVALADAKRLADAAIRFEGGPAWARREHEVAGPGPVVLALSREIARRFDASGVLAPERVVAAGASA